jgi:hypothetical protein
MLSVMVVAVMPMPVRAWNNNDTGTKKDSDQGE